MIMVMKVMIVDTYFLSIFFEHNISSSLFWTELVVREALVSKSEISLKYMQWLFYSVPNHGSDEPDGRYNPLTFSVCLSVCLSAVSYTHLTLPTMPDV